MALTPVPDEWSPESVRVHQATGDGWRELNGSPTAHVGAATWTGSEVLFWAGCDCGGLGGRAVEGGDRLRL